MLARALGQRQDRVRVRAGAQVQAQEQDRQKEMAMDSGDLLALGLALGFLMGWVVAFVQESQSRKAAELALRLEKQKVAARDWKLMWAYQKVALMEKDQQSRKEKD